MLIEPSQIWSVIYQSISIHAKGFPLEKVEFSTKVRDVFPTKTFKDNEANRFGAVIIDCFRLFNLYYGIDLKLDFKPRTEFEIFETFGDLHFYFYLRIKDSI
jgi:hypothetical protein